jgi:hypothetical protein
MWNSKEVSSRLALCKQEGVAMTNYGLVIAYSLGIVERALSPFESVLQSFRSSKPTSPTGNENHNQLSDISSYKVNYEYKTQFGKHTELAQGDRPKEAE